MACAVLEGFHAEQGRLPWFYSWDWLQQIDILSQAELQTINAKVDELGGYG